ncbi:MAG: SGNH/GDSL hydrolase family protein [Oscillospiraceae bacterium]|nr:SGNH/GDSL hydrolase family protein [Oscillospiraceae bacterium]
MELKGKKINFLGDSITKGTGASTYPNCYVAQFAAKTGAICRNYGIGGTRIARKKVPSEVARRDQDFCSRVEEMDPDADLIVVFGGSNDYGHGDAPLGKMSDRTVWSFYGALHVLYTSLIEKYPTAPIVVLTPLHRVTESDKQPELRDFVSAVREVAEYYSLPVLDLFAASGLQPCVPVIRERFIPDGLHPNDAGHAVLADKLISFLKQM